MTLAETKDTIREDIRARIDSGTAVAGEVLPLNPLRIEIVGTSLSSLQARIIYRDRAPYYFRVALGA